MRPLTGSARALHRIRSGDEVTDSGSSTHSRRGGRRRSGRQNCKSNQRGKQYSQNGSPPAGHMQPQPDCDTGQVVTATGHTALRIRGTARAEEDSALEQSVELMASVRDLPLPMTLARLWGVMRAPRKNPRPTDKRSEFVHPQDIGSFLGRRARQQTVDTHFRGIMLYSDRMEQRIERHKAWRLEYREERYL